MEVGFFLSKHSYERIMRFDEIFLRKRTSRHKYKYFFLSSDHSALLILFKIGNDFFHLPAWYILALGTLRSVLWLYIDIWSQSFWGGGPKPKLANPAKGGPGKVPIPLMLKVWIGFSSRICKIINIIKTYNNVYKWNDSSAGRLQYVAITSHCRSKNSGSSTTTYFGKKNIIFQSSFNPSIKILFEIITRFILVHVSKRFYTWQINLLKYWDETILFQLDIF